MLRDGRGNVKKKKKREREIKRRGGERERERGYSKSTETNLCVSRSYINKTSVTFPYLFEHKKGDQRVTSLQKEKSCMHVKKNATFRMKKTHSSKYFFTASSVLFGVNPPMKIFFVSPGSSMLFKLFFLVMVAGVREKRTQEDHKITQ